MKKFYSLFILALFSVTVLAQSNPNRLIVRDKQGMIKGFLAERIDSIFFVKEEGRVAADMQIESYNASDKSVTVSITRTPVCEAFRIVCLPTNTASQLKTDAAIANYIESQGGQMYYEDFTKGKLTGLELQDDTKYTLLTMGYDKYGIACSSSRAEFSTPRKPLVGNPSVAWSVKSVGTDNVTLSMKPNSDVKAYAICIFEKGEAESQFEQWGAFFGFANMGDMIKQFSQKEYTTNYENTWTGLTPGTDYEVYIQAWDKNGTYADMIIAPVTTKAQGGTGVAEISISIGDFGGDATNGYYQYVTFTPNDQVSLFRGMLIEKKTFESDAWGEEKLTEYLKKDNPQDPYWDMYKTNTDRWNVNPSTDYYAFAIGKNLNGEWGPLTRQSFSTPASAPAKAKANAIGKKIISGTTPYNGQAFRLFPPQAPKSNTSKLSK